MEENVSEKQQETVGQAPRKGISVTFEDGTVIHETKDIATYIKSLQKIGLERISEAFPNLVNKEKIAGAKDESQKQVDGYYIYTQMNNEIKVDNLRRFSEHLGLNLTIDGNGSTRAPKTKLRVTFPNDNHTIKKDRASETFVAAVEHMNLWLVKITGIKLNGVPIVAREKSKRYARESVSRGDFFVTFHGENEEKKKRLEEIAERLEIPIIVEIIPL